MLHWLAGGFDNLQLDIVGFLAILGESSVLVNAQVASLSYLFLLPRLIPAPQALIRTARPERLAPSTGKVVGANSGSIKDSVNHVAHLLHNGNSLPAYSVRCQRITRVDRKPDVTARNLGPVSSLSVLGCVMSMSLLVLSIVEKDGMALLATILLSLVTTLIGIGSRWSLKLMKRTADRLVPRSDVVITYPHGAFLIIKCEEEIARELYFAPEECEYHVGSTAYRVLSLVATIMLMFGVIFLGNAGLTLQICFAAAYVILNAAYWTVAALPQQWNWDLSCFRVETVHYRYDPRVTSNTSERSKNFTEALWKAIAITRSKEWVMNANISPINDAWRRWLNEAGNVAKKSFWDEKEIVLPAWNPNDRLTFWLKEEVSDAA